MMRKATGRGRLNVAPSHGITLLLLRQAQQRQSSVLLQRLHGHVDECKYSLFSYSTAVTLFNNPSREVMPSAEGLPALSHYNRYFRHLQAREHIDHHL
jgi:hypothetical protein